MPRFLAHHTEPDMGRRVGALCLAKARRGDQAAMLLEALRLEARGAELVIKCIIHGLGLDRFAGLKHLRHHEFPSECIVCSQRVPSGFTPTMGDLSSGKIAVRGSALPRSSRLPAPRELWILRHGCCVSTYSGVLVSKTSRGQIVAFVTVRLLASSSSPPYLRHVYQLSQLSTRLS